MPFGDWLQALADLVYPQRCISCRRLGTLFCPACRTDVPHVGDAICVRCGLPMTERSICTSCRYLPPGPLRGMRGVVFFAGPMIPAIYGLKYEGIPALAKPLAGYLIHYLEAHPVAFDCLVPAPLHPARQAERGYNQSELLARETSAACGIPLRTDLIQRIRHTPPQVHLNREERQENMRDAFAPRADVRLQGETVLLLDDVCTTGATLQASAEALKAAGAGDIWALTVARSRPQRQPEPWEQGLDPAQVFQAWAGLEHTS